MNPQKKNIVICSVLIVLAAVLKVATYNNSFSMTPIIAIALFSGAVISDRKLAFLLPLIAMFVSDVLLQVLNIGQGFYGIGQIGNYASLLFVTLLGLGLKKINVVNVLGFSIGATGLFYLLSNTNAFIFDSFGLYARSFSGYINCMTAGLPFLKTRIATDLFYNIILFGSYVWVYQSKLKKATV